MLIAISISRKVLMSRCHLKKLQSHWYIFKETILSKCITLHTHHSTFFLRRRGKFINHYHSFSIEEKKIIIDHHWHAFLRSKAFITHPIKIHYLPYKNSLLILCCNQPKDYWMRNNQNGGWKWNGNLYNINKIQYSQATWKR